MVAGTGDGVAPTGFSITIDNTSAAKVEVTKAQRGYVGRGGGGCGWWRVVAHCPTATVFERVHVWRCWAALAVAAELQLCHTAAVAV